MSKTASTAFKPVSPLRSGPPRCPHCELRLRFVKATLWNCGNCGSVFRLESHGLESGDARDRAKAVLENFEESHGDLRLV